MWSFDIHALVNLQLYVEVSALKSVQSFLGSLRKNSKALLEYVDPKYAANPVQPHQQTLFQ